MIRTAFIFPVLFLFVSCGTKTSTDKISSSQWELFGFLPYNTESVLYINFDNLKKSDYSFEKIFSTKDSSGSWINKFEEQSGVDLNKDISEIIIASAEDGQNVFLIRFKDDFRKVRDYFNKSPVFLRNKIGGKETYILKQNPSSQMYFPKSSILLMASGKTLFQDLLSNKGKRLKDNTKIISIVGNIKSKQNIWLAEDNGSLAADLFKRFAGKNSNVLSPKILSAVKNISLSADFSEGIKVESALGCRSAGDAYLLTSAVEGAKTMKIISRKDEKLGEIFNKMDIKREGELIRFRVALTEQELNDLKSLTKYTNQVNKF